MLTSSQRLSLATFVTSFDYMPLSSDIFSRGDEDNRIYYGDHDYEIIHSGMDEGEIANISWEEDYDGHEEYVYLIRESIETSPGIIDEVDGLLLSEVSRIIEALTKSKNS